MLLLLFAMMLFQTSHGVEFSMQSSNRIREHGVEYEQRLSYDPVTDVLKLEVPAHLEIDASISIFDAKQDLQVVYTPRHNLCQIDKVPKNFSAKKMMRMSLDFQLKGENLGHENATDVYEMDIYTPMSSYAFKQLPQYVQEMCAGKMVNRVRSVSVSKEDFYSSKLHLFPHHEDPEDHPRRKRQFLPLCDDTADLCTTDANWGYRCRWLLIETENVSDDVRNQVYHGRSSRFSCVMCCKSAGGSKYSTASGFCKCDRIRTKSDFQGCYPQSGAMHG